MELWITPDLPLAAEPGLRFLLDPPPVLADWMGVVWRLVLPFFGG